jgi:hypothetical protein
MAMPPELVDHPLTEDGPFGRVMQDVHPDQTVEQTPIFNRLQMSHSDIAIRL